MAHNLIPILPRKGTKTKCDRCAGKSGNNPTGRHYLDANGPTVLCAYCAGILHAWRRRRARAKPSHN